MVRENTRFWHKKFTDLLFRWVLIPHEGCQECDACTDALIFSVADLSEWLKNETQDFKVSTINYYCMQRHQILWSFKLNYILNLYLNFFQDKADSFFTTQRLNYIANKTQSLQPRVAALKAVDLVNVTSAVESVEISAKNALRSVI